MQPLHSLEIEGVVNDLYNVAILSKSRRMIAIGFRSDEIRRAIAMG
jgi:hypothetical protein